MGKALDEAMKINPGWVEPADMEAIEKRLPKGKATVLEIGTGYARSTVFMANVNPELEIYTVDELTAPSLGLGNEKEKCRQIINNNIKDYPNIHFIEADSRTVTWDKQIDFIFIDGRHDYDFIKSDFERFSPFLKKDGIIAFHDYTVTREGFGVKKYLDEIGLPLEVEANVAFWKNPGEDTKTILAKTEEYYASKEEHADLRPRIEYSRHLKPGSTILDFGTGNGRVAFIMAMANPAVGVFTFDKGRKEIDNPDYLERTWERARKLGVKNIHCSIQEASMIGVTGKVDGINMDIEGEYELIKPAVDNCFPFVKRGGTIFVMNYALDDDFHCGIKKAVDEFLKEHKEYQLKEVVRDARTGVILKI